MSADGLLAKLERAYADFTAFAMQTESSGRLDELWRNVLNKPPSANGTGGAPVVIEQRIVHTMDGAARNQTSGLVRRTRKGPDGLGSALLVVLR